LTQAGLTDFRKREGTPMSNQLPLADRPYPALPPVAVNIEAMERFDQEMDVRLKEFESRFYVPRQHPTIEMPRHRQQPPRKPR
jgi:hypothetical protein